MHILSPVTGNCPSWISGREKMTVEIISWPISTKESCWTWGSNPQPSAYQVDAHPIELPYLACPVCLVFVSYFSHCCFPTSTSFLPHLPHPCPCPTPISYLILCYVSLFVSYFSNYCFGQWYHFLGLEKRTKSYWTRNSFSISGWWLGPNFYTA